MESVNFGHASKWGYVRVEEVDPSVPTDVRVVRRNYRVEEPEDALHPCVDTAEVVATPNLDADEQLAEDERRAKDDLIVLLMGHLEFATAIKDAVRECGRAGYTLRATCIHVTQMVGELRAARKKDGMRRIAGVLGGVATGLCFGNPIGLTVGAFIGIGAHFTPWGVASLFWKVDRDTDVEWQALFRACYRYLTDTDFRL